MHEANALARRIIGRAIEAHRHLGPGLTEIAYERALARELTDAGIGFVRQVAIPVSYKGEVIAEYRPDFIVSDLVVLEIKSVDRVTPVHEAQMLTYLRVTGRELGFVLNFNTAVLRHGIHRVVLQRGSRSLDNDAFDPPP